MKGTLSNPLLEFRMKPSALVVVGQSIVVTHLQPHSISFPDDLYPLSVGSKLLPEAGDLVKCY
jgi:hypothetical protein